MLDLDLAINQARAQEGLAPVELAPSRRDDLKVVLVAPAGEELPDDGILNYVRVESVYDMKDVPERAIALFDVRTAVDVLKLICANAPLFGLEVRVLVGLPNTAYPVSFDEATWNLERIAYATLVSEIRMAAETEAQRRTSLLSGHDVERQRYTRANGSVRVDHKIDVAAEDDGVEDDENA